MTVKLPLAAAVAVLALSAAPHGLDRSAGRFGFWSSAAAQYSDADIRKKFEALRQAMESGAITRDEFRDKMIELARHNREAVDALLSGDNAARSDDKSPPPAASDGGGDLGAKMQALSDALASGLISGDEYRNRLRALMDGETAPPPAAAPETASEPPPPPTATAGGDDFAAKLDALREARDSGLINGEEYGNLVRALKRGESASPAPAPNAAPAGSFQNFQAQNGARVSIGLVGAQPSLEAAIGATLRDIDASFGSRPTVTQAAVNRRARTATVFFSVSSNGASYSGMAIIDAGSGSQSSAIVIFDTAQRFASTIDGGLLRVRELVQPGNGGGEPVQPAEPLSPINFSDGTGQISLPGDWTLLNASGGSVMARGPTGEIVAYNSDALAFDSRSQQGMNYFNSLPANIRASTLGRYAQLAYSNDPAQAWQQMLPQLARQHNLQRLPWFNVTDVNRMPVGATTLAEISGEAYMPGILGNASDETGTYLAYVQTTPPDRLGQWNMFYSWAFVPKTQMARYGATAAAIFASVRINEAAVQQQFNAIRESFQRKFEAMIQTAREQDAAREQSTEHALATDRAAQESMHKQAVAVCNYVLDRQTIVDRVTGLHSTVDSWFADHLVQSSSDFEKVPASRLLPGIDY